jgi:hypothetical protein
MPNVKGLKVCSAAWALVSVGHTVSHDHSTPGPGKEMRQGGY